MIETVSPLYPWLTVDRLNPDQYPRWAALKISALNGEQSGGDVNVYVWVNDEAGLPIAHAPVLQTNGGQTPLFTKASGEVDFNQTHDSCFDPAKKVGPYAVSIIDKNIPSEKVSGMGLPHCFHWSYGVVFQRQLTAPEQPPPPPPTEPPGALLVAIRAGNVLTTPGSITVNGNVYNLYGDKSLFVLARRQSDGSFFLYPASELV